MRFSLISIRRSHACGVIFMGGLVGSVVGRTDGGPDLSDGGSGMRQANSVLLLGSNSALMEFVAYRLRRDARLSIVCNACSPNQGIEIAAEPETIDLALIDLDVMDGCCADFVRTLRTMQPQCRVVLLSAVVGPAQLAMALDVRASALVWKSELPDTLGEAVCEALEGGVWLPESARSQIVVDSIGARLDPPSAEDQRELVDVRSRPSKL